jgi:aconitate hydratase
MAPRPKAPTTTAWWTIDLSKVEPIGAIPFHPSEAVTIPELQQNADILRALENVSAGSIGGKFR